jgi:Zn-dependent peptidase ImmA (M78 family)/DNA-binding XRE family transcriptional regulator
MSVGVKSFNGHRLIQAKNARGLTSVSLSEMVDISTASISLYEKGVQKPKLDVLERIATVLNVPVSFFFNDIQIEKPKKLFYRSMSSATKISRTKAEAQYEWVLEIIDYLMEFFDFPELNLPDIDVPDNFRLLDSNQIESIAQNVRDYWGLGSSPIANIVRTLESNGIVVWRTAFEAETLDAFSEYRKPHPIIVLSSDKTNYFRSRFDAPHELGHLILHRNIDQTTLNKSADFKIIENQAHLFAAAFLLPSVSYSNDLWSPTLDAFRSLKPRWNVSIAMQIMKCKHLGLINEDQEKRLWINLNRRKWKASEPLDDSTPVEMPNLISKSIKMLIEKNVKSKEQIANDLSFHLSEIERICELPSGFMRGKQDIDQPMFKQQGSNILKFSR